MPKILKNFYEKYAKKAFLALKNFYEKCLYNYKK